MHSRLQRNNQQPPEHIPFAVLRIVWRCALLGALVFTRISFACLRVSTRACSVTPMCASVCVYTKCHCARTRPFIYKQRAGACGGQNVALERKMPAPAHPSILGAARCARPSECAAQINKNPVWPGAWTSWNMEHVPHRQIAFIDIERVCLCNVRMCINKTRIQTTHKIVHSG